MASQGDVVVNIAVMLQGMQKAMKQLKSQIGSIAATTTGASQEMARGFSNVQGVTKGLNKQFKSPAIRQFNANLQSTNKQMSKFSKQGGNMANHQFPEWALSLMFTGMILQRAFHTIWKSATTTFNDVMSKVNDQTTSFERLSNSLEYLKFTVGQALEPLAAMLVPIVNRMADFVAQNPKLARLGTIILGLAGYAMWFGSQIALLVSAMNQLGVSASWLSGIFSGTLAAAIAGVVLNIHNHWGNVTGWVENWANTIKNTFKSFIDNGEQILSGLGDIIIGIWEGDWTKAWKGMKNVSKGGLKFMLNAITGFSTGMVNLFVSAFNMIVDSFSGTVDMIMEGIILVMEGMDEIAGTDLASSFEEDQEQMNEMFDNFRLDRISSERINRATNAGEMMVENPSEIPGMISRLFSGETVMQSPDTGNIQRSGFISPKERRTTVNVEVNDSWDSREVDRQYRSGR